MLESLNIYSPIISAFATVVIAGYAIVTHRQSHALQKQVRNLMAAQVVTEVLGQVAANKGSISQGIAEFKKHFKEDLDIFK